MFHPIEMRTAPLNVNNTESKLILILSAVLIVLGIVIPVLPLHLGFYPWKDEEYQLLCMADYRNNPLSGFTMFVGYIWSHSIGGETFLSFRILAYICNTISILLPCVYFYFNSRQVLLSCAMFFVLQLTISAFGLYSYEWDIMSNLTLALCCLTAVCYLKKPSYGKIIILSVLTAISIYSRIPKIALLPVTLILISVTPQSIKRKIIDSIIFIFVTIISSELLNLLIWGGVENFIKVWNPENVITGHKSIFGMVVSQFWGYYPTVFGYIAIWIGLYASVWFIYRTLKESKWRVLAIIVIGFTLLTFLLVVRATTHDAHRYGIEVFLFTIILIPMIALYKNKPMKFPILLSLTLLAYSAVSFVGSDCGLAKLLSLPLMPLAFAELYRYRIPSVKAFYVMLGTVVVISYPVLRVKDPATKDWINLYSDTYAGIDKLKGMKGSASDVRFVTGVYDWAIKEKNDGHKILFLGPKRYLFDYILNNDEDWVNRYPVQRYHDDNDFETIGPKMDGIIDGFDYVFLNFKFDDSQLECVTDRLAQKGFSLYLTDDNYTIYKKWQPTK